MREAPHRVKQLRRATLFIVSLTLVALSLLLPKFAQAAAPLCDPRGASVFAPPPQLRLPQPTAATAPAQANAEECPSRFADVNDADTASIERGRGHDNRSSDAPVPRAILATIPRVLPSPRERRASEQTARIARSDGWYSAIERPPRRSPLHT